MLVVTIIILCVTIYLLSRFIAFKKEVKKLTKQLQIYRNRKTNKKIDLALFDQDIENLAFEMNKLIDLYMNEYRKRVHFENEQQQAIANMSHDLRTPLTSILGYIQMAESNNATDLEKKEWLTTAKNRAKRLEALLNDFFELSIIESKDHLLETKTINLRNLTIDILMSFYDRFSEKGMEPILHLPKQDIFIISDEIAVTRVMENLISNAITHSDGTIMISLEEKESNVRLLVINDAPSLTDKDIERMFDRFYMADQSRSGKNTGLGLSIAKALMKKMNGTISGRLDQDQLSIICEWELAKNK